jgi:hypothetical protein
MRRSALVPPDSAPRRVDTDLAAGHCGDHVRTIQFRVRPEEVIERLDRAIQLTARCMVNHRLPQILPTLKRLQAERDRLLQEGNALEYARRVLAA